MFYRGFIALALSLGIVGAAQAQTVNITPLMENECQWDYHNFCGQYAIGSELLDLCFKQNGPTVQGLRRGADRGGRYHASLCGSPERTGRPLEIRQCQRASLFDAADARGVTRMPEMPQAGEHHR